VNISDQQAFRQLLGGVYSYYRTELTPFHIDVFWQGLKAYPFNAVKDAFNRHLVNPDNGQFLPKLADVVKLIDGGTADRALIAWTKFELAVGHVGAHRSVVFDDAIIHAVAEDMGGWVHLCGKKIDEWPFVRNEFVNRYRAYAMKPLTTYPAKLIGISEAHNGADGRLLRFIDPPTFVGIEERAREVMHNGAMGGATRLKQIGELTQEYGEGRNKLLGLK
jgi:hypothetical protein